MVNVKENLCSPRSLKFLTQGDAGDASSSSLSSSFEILEIPSSFVQIISAGVILFILLFTWPFFLTFPSQKTEKKATAQVAIGER